MIDSSRSAIHILLMARSNDSKIAVAYLRVSTDDQKNGPEAQRAAIESWAAREGVSVVAWHVDQGVSGATPVAQRPALVAALASLREHGAGVLVAAKRDRIARDVTVAESVTKMATKEGATVRTVDGMSDAKGSAGMIQRGVSDLFAAYEREVIRERTTAALAVKKAKGECVGRVPFGYRLAADGIHLEPNEDEQATVILVHELSAKGLSRRAIVAELASRGVVSRAGKALQVTQIGRILAAAA